MNNSSVIYNDNPNALTKLKETDWSLLENTEENKITMITCIPNRREQRLCVQATEIMEKI